MTITAQRDRSNRCVVRPLDERGWRRRERELSSYTASLVARASKALDVSVDVSDVDATSASWHCINTLASRCAARLSEITDATDIFALHLCDLVLELYELSVRLCQHEVARRERRIADCEIGIRRLGTLPSSADLLEQACQELVGRAGFGRAGISRIESGCWRPWAGHFSGGKEFDSWWPAWIDRPIPLGDSTPETEAMAAIGPVVVHDIETTPTYRPIADDAGLLSYVVAPIVRDGEVIGFVHADHLPSRRRVDLFDGEAISTFADGLSRLFERFALTERLRGQSDLARTILAETARAVDNSVDRGQPFPRSDAVIPRDARLPVEELTTRESEVYELLVTGATNSAIAHTLVIAEHTVKSHVKQILRKLGVSNRSQAIATSVGGLVAGNRSGQSAAALLAWPEAGSEQLR